MTKEAMIAHLRVYFQCTGSYTAILENVPYGSFTLDMVLIDEHGKYTAVCVHPTHWKDIHRKAREAALGAEYAYICISADKFPQQDKTALCQQGVGILLFTRMESIKRICSPTSYGIPLATNRNLLLRGVNSMLRQSNPSPTHNSGKEP